MRRLLGLVLLVLSALPALAGEKPVAITEDALRESAARAMQVAQKSQRVWYEKGQFCISCHHQNLPLLVQSSADLRGVGADPRFSAEVAAKTFPYLKDLDTAVQGAMYIDDIDEASRLISAHEAGVPANLTTSAIAQGLAGTQRADGSWYTIDARPPQSHGRISTTALAARAISLTFPESLSAKKQSVLSKARDWLVKATPRSTEEQAYRLLGLLWSGADETVRKQPAEQLLAAQRADGGWSQLPGMASDAYSTGEVLVALHQAGGVATDAEVYRKGLAFLLSTQTSDGSWRVESRLTRQFNMSPEYFNAGFPHGRDHQFMSIMGTSMATLAVLEAIPTRPGAAKTPVPDVKPDDKDAWIHAALNGTAADLEKALDAGMSPNAKTAHGTTALMLAARDPEKVKLLLDRGADVNARAESGFTALMVAARVNNNAETVKRLLKAGAKATSPKDVRFDASALFFAAAVGDVESARALLDAGASPSAKMLVLGLFTWTPMTAATMRGDSAMVELLVRRGADANEAGTDETRPLMLAVLTNHADTVKVLLANGAKVNATDNLDVTALHYAAAVPYEDATIAQLLLAAGADRNAKDKKGRTPHDLATALKHPTVTAVLAGKTAGR